MDHQALLYLVNKPCATGRIVRWFIILLEFDFTVAVKKGSTHLRADHLSTITSGEAPTGGETMNRDYRSLMVLFIALPVDEQCQVADEVLHQADSILVDGNPVVDFRVRLGPTGYSIEISTSEPLMDDDE